MGLAIAEKVIECRNCGDGGDLDWIALLAVAIAGAALFFNAREHRAFMRQQRARARFKFEWRVESDARKPALSEPFVLSDTARPVIRIRMLNYGDRAAEAVLLNVLAPETVQELKWCRADGSEFEDQGQPIAAPEPLRDVDGSAMATVFLDDTIGRITRKGDFLVFFSCVVTPSADATEWSVPFAVTAQADAMPDDVAEYRDDVWWRLKNDLPE